MKQPEENKWTTPYERVLYTVYEIRGSQILARRTTDGPTVCRDASEFKLVNYVMGTMNVDELSWEEKLVIYRNRDEQQTKQTVLSAVKIMIEVAMVKCVLVCRCRFRKGLLI